MALLSSKVKGIFRVSFANIIALSVSLLTSFLLPYFITVEEYGYWQLFVLYSGYVGFFALGFNDGIHLNYAGENYTAKLQAKFHAFFNWILSSSLLETLFVILAIVIFLDKGDKRALLILSALNIVPVLVNGLFTYLNQSTFRFKQYSRGSIIDKLIFLVIMLFLLAFKRNNSIEYIIAYTFSRYCVILYNLLSSKEVVTVPSEKISSLRYEVKANYINGIPLLVANLLNSTIITCGRFLVENKFGIEDFSAYSFSLHTLIIASQFISAIASVFYPIMKRCNEDDFKESFYAFDGFSTLLSSVLMLSYYPAVLCVNYLYKDYVNILSYLYIVYPLFIFQCKSNLLIINVYKVKQLPRRLVVINLMAIGLQVIFLYIFYYIFESVTGVAFATVLAYAIWYFMSVLYIHYENHWPQNYNWVNDLILLLFFLSINLLVNYYIDNFFRQLLYSGVLYIIFISCIYFMFSKRIHNVFVKTKNILKD